MNRMFYIVAGLASSMAGAWYFMNRRRHAASMHTTPRRPRGEVIYDNTPTANV
jgi:hypothetical protein